eukprot:jgi/Chlat1/7378/Chrsp6S07480
MLPSQSMRHTLPVRPNTRSCSARNLSLKRFAAYIVHWLDRTGSCASVTFQGYEVQAYWGEGVYAVVGGGIHGSAIAKDAKVGAECGLKITFCKCKSSHDPAVQGIDTNVVVKLGEERRQEGLVEDSIPHRLLGEGLAPAVQVSAGHDGDAVQEVARTQIGVKRAIRCKRVGVDAYSSTSPTNCLSAVASGSLLLQQGVMPMYTVQLSPGAGRYAWTWHPKRVLPTA